MSDDTRRQDMIDEMDRRDALETALDRKGYQLEEGRVLVLEIDTEMWSMKCTTPYERTWVFTSFEALNGWSRGLDTALGIHVNRVVTQFRVEPMNHNLAWTDGAGGRRLIEITAAPMDRN